MLPQLDAWIAAVDAFARRDAETVAILVMPDHLCGKAAYHHLIAMSLVGSYTCAANLARANGHAIGRVPVGYAYVVEVDDPAHEPSAKERVAAGAISSCLSADFNTATNTFAMYAAGGPDDGLDRLVDLVMHLLGLCVRMTPTAPLG